MVPGVGTHCKALCLQQPPQRSIIVQAGNQTTPGSAGISIGIFNLRKELQVLVVQ